MAGGNGEVGVGYRHAPCVRYVSAPALAGALRQSGLYQVLASGQTGSTARP